MKNIGRKDNIDKIKKSYKTKKAITLMTLLVTIIVILILTSAVIFTIRKSNTINSANKTVLRNDLQSIKDSYREKYNDLLFDYNGKKENIPKEELEDVVPEEYRPDFVILPEGPAYVGKDEETIEIAEEMGYIIGYPEERIEIDYIDLQPIEDRIVVNVGIKETDLEIKNVKYYISIDGITWIDADSTELTHEFTGLEEFTEYQIKVVITDENNNQTESKVYIAKTKMRDFEPGTLTLTKNTPNGEPYISGDWTNQSVYIKVNEDPEPTIKTTYEVVGANVVDKGTTEEKRLDNSGISKIKVTTVKYGVVKTREYEVKIDKDNPVINSLVSSNTNPTNQNVIITASAIDTLSGIVEFQFSTDGNLDVNSNGWETIDVTTNDMSKNKVITENGTYYFYVKDVAGNVSKKEIIIDNIDKIPPTLNSINVISPETGIYKAGQEVQIVATFSENIKGYAPRLKIKFGNSEERTITTGEIKLNTITYKYTIQDEDNGVLISTNFNGSVTDLVGNNLNVENMVLGGNKITADTTPPTKLPPQLVSNTNSITATFKQTDSLSGINSSTKQFAIKGDNDNTWSDWVTSEEDSYTFEGLIMNTSYQVKTRVSDNVGNSAESEIATISTVNITKPSLSAPTDWTNTSVAVTITYPEIVGTIKQYSIDGEIWNNVDGITYIVNVDTNNTTVYARVIDSANQTSGNATYTVTCIDKELPTVEIGTNGGNYTMNLGSSNITIATFLLAKDTGGSGLNSMQYQLSTSNTIPTDDDLNWKNFTNGDTITENVPGGIYYIYTKVTDLAGNRAVSIQKSNPYTTQYQIKYDANGGVGEPTEQIKIHNQKLNLSDVKPTRVGYTFIGWNTDKDATTAIYTSSQEFLNNEPTLLYAIWSINTYTVQYDANGGTNAPESQTKTFGVDLKLSDQKPIRQGHTFIGWNTDKNATVAEYLSGSNYINDEDTTLYAIWSIDTYTVQYDANGGLGAPAPQTKTYGIDLTLSEVVPTKDGHIFLGWSTEKDAINAEYQPNSKYVKNEEATLYAIWSINTYTVQYDANGGTDAPVSQTKAFGEDLVLSPEIPLKEGYTFLGWSAIKNSTIAEYTAGGKFSANEDTMLYAVWRINTYSVFYDTNGGIGNIEEQTKTYGVDLILSSVVPTKEGYTFLGWSKRKGVSTAEYLSGATYTKNESMMLYAVWEINDYSVKYNANGGTDAPDEQIKTFNEDLILSSKTPTREGYSFVGWNTNKDATTAEYSPNDVYLKNEPLTLYAIWRANTYSVSFNPNYGNGGPGTQTKTYGIDLIISDQIPTRGGYTFIGWSTNKDATTPEYLIGDKYTDNSSITLYAVWKMDTYTVRYDANGGTGAPEDQIKEAKYILQLSSDIPRREGHSFIGWSTDKDATIPEYLVGGYYNENRDITLYAIWSVGISTIFYDLNGGTAGPNAQTKNYGEDLTLSDVVPTKEGYTFLGWSITKTGTTVNYNPGDIYSDNNDIVLYAIWQANSYTITFDAKGGTTPNPQTITKPHGTEVGELPTTTKEGHIFRGWFMEVIETDTKVEGIGHFIPTTLMPANDLTLYAMWESVPDVTVVENPKDFTTIEMNQFQFAIGAQGYNNFSFQWYYNTTNSNVGGTLIPGATSHVYNSTATLDMDGRYYYCVVNCRSEDGRYSGTATSNPAKLNVTPAYYTVTKGGKTYYTDALQTADYYAVSGASDNEGGMITVIRDVPKDKVTGITKSVKFNTNQKTVNIDAIGMNSNNLTFSIMGGGTIISPDSILFENRYNSIVNINNVTMRSQKTGGATIVNSGNGTISLTNVTATSADGSRVIINMGGGTVNVNSGSISTRDISISNSGSGTVNINGGTISSINIANNVGSGILNVTNGNFTCSVGNVFINTGTGILRVNGNNITLTSTSIAAVVANQNESGRMEITDATIKMQGNESAILNSGECAINNAKITAVSTSYYQFSGTTDIIDTTMNSDDNTTVRKETGNITINNSNLTSNDSSYYQSSGTCNVTNTIMTSGNNNTLIGEGGNITINSGEYTSRTANVAFMSRGTLTVKNGRFESLSKNMALVNCDDATTIVKDGTFIGGQLVSKDTTVDKDQYGVLTHTEGTYIPAIVTGGIFTMSGGTVNAGGMGIANVAGTATITGGTVTSTDIALSIDDGTVNVGSSSTPISTTNPIFTGLVGSHHRVGRFNFYNGILRGENYSYYGTINGRRNGAIFTEGTSGKYKVAYYR